jgi:GAF domain-containing protein
MPSDRPSKNRVRVLSATHLLDSPPEPAFDRLTRLASGLLHAPVALVSLVDDRRQFFKSALGLKEPWASRRETPLTHSFCQYAARDRAALIVEDAREHPLLRENLAIRDLDVIAYAGMPLIVADEAIGALCVIDGKPRAWTAEEVRLLEDLAASVVSEIELRLALRATREQRAITDALIESLGDGVLAIDPERR